MQRTAGTPLSDDEQLVLKLVLADLRSTVGDGYEVDAINAAERVQPFCTDLAMFEDRLVSDIQQYLHDTFVDTTWPQCPDHPNHPMWLVQSWWRCGQSGRQITPLGSLPLRAK